jgi:hypothetical protein
MGNPETKATLGYDIVQRQSNERQLKDEHGPHRKTGLTIGIQITTTYTIRAKYYENVRPNKYMESRKTNLGESFL